MAKSDNKSEKANEADKAEDLKKDALKDEQTGGDDKADEEDEDDEDEDADADNNQQQTGTSKKQTKPIANPRDKFQSSAHVGRLVQVFAPHREGPSPGIVTRSYENGSINVTVFEDMQVPRPHANVPPLPKYPEDPDTFVADRMYWA